MPRISRTALEWKEYLLANATIKSNGCLVSHLAPCGMGYILVSLFGRQGKKWKAHRLLWTLEHGEIPEGMVICHSCDNGTCLNIDHYFIGTRKDNTQDMMKKGRNRYIAKPVIKVTPEILSRILLYREQGWNYTQISRAVGVSISTISNYLSPTGVYNANR